MGYTECSLSELKRLNPFQSWVSLEASPLVPGTARRYLFFLSSCSFLPSASAPVRMQLNIQIL